MDIEAILMSAQTEMKNISDNEEKAILVTRWQKKKKKRLNYVPVLVVFGRYNLQVIKMDIT